jgi:excisionase family DNA binding protein
MSNRNLPIAAARDHGLEPLVVSPKAAWRLLGCGNTHGYELIAAGELESYKEGKSRRITMASIRSHIDRKLGRTKAMGLLQSTKNVDRGVA